jgi:hypothetical protein
VRNGVTHVQQIAVSALLQARWPFSLKMRPEQIQDAVARLFAGREPKAAWLAPGLLPACWASSYKCFDTLTASGKRPDTRISDLTPE